MHKVLRCSHKVPAKKKAFAALEKDLLGKLSASTMQSGEGRGVKRPRVSDSAYDEKVHMHIDASLIDK